MLSSVFSIFEKKFKLPNAILLAPILLFNNCKFFPFSLPTTNTELRGADGYPQNATAFEWDYTSENTPFLLQIGFAVNILILYVSAVVLLSSQKARCFDTGAPLAWRATSRRSDLKLSRVMVRDERMNVGMKCSFKVIEPTKPTKLLSRTTN